MVGSPEIVGAVETTRESWLEKRKTKREISSINIYLIEYYVDRGAVSYKITGILQPGSPRMTAGITLQNLWGGENILELDCGDACTTF